MNEKVLLIDDEAMLLKITSRLLEKLGVHVEPAPNGDVAVSLFKTDPQGFSFVIIDYNLEGMSCKDTLKQLRSLNPTIRSVIATGFVAEEIMKELKEWGVVAALQKPFALPELKALLEKMRSLQ